MKGIARRNAAVPAKEEWFQVKDRAEWSYAFPRTVPVMVGYLFLGTAYGILMNVNGFGIGWTAAASLLVYAGSL